MNWYNLNETTDRELRTAVVIRTLYDRGRKPVIEAVCDAIEGFCEETCITTFWALPFDVRVRDSRSRYITSCDCIGEHFLLRGNDPCPNCGKRIVETFDILKKEGV